MKRKIFSILFALVLVLSLGLVTAVPAAVSASGTTFTREGSNIEVLSQHLCDLGYETEVAFDNEPETLVLDGVAFDAQTCSQVTIEGEVSDLVLGAGWVDTAYIEIGLRPEATMNTRNAGVYLIAFNLPDPGGTRIHLQDYTGSGQSGGLIDISTPNTAFHYKITLEPSGDTGGTATLEVWVGEDSKGTVTLPYGYASTWEEGAAGALDEDFSNAHLFYSIIADRRGIADQTYSATVGDITIDDTLYVGTGQQFTTIQDAIDAAGDGDTINVAAGIYDPFTVDGKTGLTIQSSSVVTVQGVQSVTTAYTDRDCVVFVKDSTNIVLDGLDIQGQGLGPTKNYGVIYENSSGEVKDCTVSPNTVGDMVSMAIGIWDGSDVDVESCTAENYGRVGVLIYNGCTVDIIGGSIEGQVYTGEGEVCYGVEVEGGYQTTDPETASHVTIDGVEIYNCDNTFSPQPSWESAGILINGWLEHMDAADSTVIVENNDIHDNYIGIYAVKTPSSYAHSNNIYDNRDFGVESADAYDGTTTVFDATNNWWGNASGPTHAGNTFNVGFQGDKVSDYVDYVPWCDTDMTGASFGPVTNEDTGDKFSSIQSAIDSASPDDIISVAAGTYNEQVIIEYPTSNISLVGAGRDSTTIDAGSKRWGAIDIIGASHITISGFTLRNRGETSQDYGINIVCYGFPATAWSTYITVEDCTLDADEYGIRVHNYSEASHNIFRRNIITSDYSGIHLEYTSQNTVTQNTISSATGFAGINLGIAGDDNTVQYNEISGCKYGVNLVQSQGGSSGNVISNNEITNNERGIWWQRNPANVIEYNNIFNNTAYNLYAGSYFILEAPAPAENNWWGQDTPDTAKFYGEVDYTPWSTSPNPIVPPPVEVWVDDGFDSSTSGWSVDHFAAIQPAINAVAEAGTVSVAAGTYDENLLIDKALTLTGTDGATETIIDGTSTYIVNIVHSDVTFEGFTVTNPENEGGGDISGILIGGWNYTPIPENVKILNNIVKQVRSETGTPSTFATTGINVGTSENVVISGNTITDIKNPGDPVGSSASDHTCGINVWGDTLTGSSRNIVISNNIISDIKYNGIILEGAIDVQIGENDITGCESGVRVKPREGEISNVQIGENDITGCEYGISVVPEAFTLSGLTINLNNFADNLIQVFDGAEALDIQQVLGNNDFDRAVVIDREGGLLLHTIWSKIQAAIDAANPAGGDTINVAAGTYSEAIVIDKQLTLEGANAGINPVTETRGSESIIYGETSTAITISADDVIVDGFTLDGGITLDDAVNSISGGTISNNIITGADNPEEPIKAQNGIRLGWDSGKGVDGITIENNTIINSLCKGIRFANPKLGDGGGTASNITISGNEIKDNGSAGMETYGPGLNTIINNSIIGNDGNGINLKFDDGDVVTGNIITNNTGPGITLRQVTDTTVENNSVSGHVSQEVIKTCESVIGGKGSGIHIFDTSEDNTIRFNDISGNNYGIFIHSKGDLQPSGNSINFNNIYGNTGYGILNALVDPPAPVDATNNWWGTTTDDEVAAMVSGSVAYDPWHLKQISDSTANNPTESSVDLSWTTTGAWDGDYFDVRYSTSAITAENWSKARKVTGEPTPATTVNTRQGMRVHRLSENTTYHFGLKLIDKDIGSSDISNIVSATTLTTAPTDTTPPSVITHLEAATGTPSTKKVILSWTAKGDDETVGIASKYIIKQSTSNITAANFDSATTVHNNLRCKSNGESESFTVRRLTPNTTYYFAIKIQDEVPNTSAISNVVNITTANLLPTVTNISPTTGDNGAARTLTITGTNFTSSGTTVMRLISDDNTFHLTNVTYVSATQLTAVLPIGAPTGTYKARVINNNGRSALSSATYIVTAPALTPPPAVTNLIPQMAASNTAVSGVKIFGENLTGATAVRFGDTAATSFTVISDTKITADVPGLTVGEYDVKVTTPTPAGTNSISAVKFKVSAPVVVNTDTTEDTTTSEVIDLGDTNVTPVQITLTTDTSETATQATDTDAEIEVVIPPQTTVTDSEGNDYTGNINPPRVVKPDESVLTDLADNAVVIEMGNPEKTINFDQDFVMTIIITTDTEPVIWYYNKDTKAYELAGKTGTKDGIDYVPGGTKLNQEDNTYIMGLLLDHMSPYVAGVNPHITSAPATATADVAFTISGTNFHTTGANVYFNGTAGTIISQTSTTQIVVTFPAAGSYTLKVENPDRLSDTTSITLGPYVGVRVGGGVGGPAPPPPGTTDVRGEVSPAGVFLESVTAISEDELCSLNIPEGTVGLTEELEPPTKINMLIMDEPPSPPEDAHIVGLAYDFGPDGATFDPAMTLEYTYDPADIPEGMAEEDLVIAYYDQAAGEWVELEGCVVDTENNTITAPVSHFTTFAVIARAPAAPPPVLAPAAITSSSLTISPREVDIGETVTISVLVVNTGEEEGRYTVTLNINGVVEQTREITLAGGASETATFTLAEDEAGTYSVNIDGLTGSFTVREVAVPPPVVPPEIPPPGVNWAIWGPVIGVAVFLAIFLPIKLRRRA